MEQERIEEMYQLKNELETPKIETGNQKIKVEEILYYGTIKIKNKEQKEEEKSIYCVKERINKKQQIVFFADNQELAIVGKEGKIEILPEFANRIKEIELLDQLEKAKEQFQDKEPISLSELEQKEMEREKQKGVSQKQKKKVDKKKELEQNEEEREEEEQEDPKTIRNNDIEIKMNARITPDKTIADIIPEIKEKECRQVKIRTDNNIDFQLYGIDKNGKEVELQSIQQTEGTNPNQPMTKISADGTKMEQTSVSTMLKIQSGRNEKAGREGLGIKIGEAGIEEVLYYRRDVQDRYIGVPVGLETTNEKRTNREVQEIASRPHNTEVDDEITLVEVAAKRCNMSVDGFLQQYEKAKGDSIQERIANTEEEINNQYMGREKREK